MQMSSVRPTSGHDGTASEPLTLTNTTESYMLAADLFHSAGFLWLRQVGPRTVLEQCVPSADASLARQPADQTVRVGSRRYVLHAPVDGAYAHPDLLTNRTLMALMRQLLGEDMVLNSFGIVAALAGAERQNMHRDHPALFNGALDLPPYAITVMLPLIDLSVDTGTTAIWEGSHRWNDQDAHGQPPLLPYAAIGDAYLMDYRLVHAGAPNRTSTARPILYAVYSKPWFRDTVNFITFPPLSLGKAGIELAAQYRDLFRWAAAMP